MGFILPFSFVPLLLGRRYHITRVRVCASRKAFLSHRLQAENERGLVGWFYTHEIMRFILPFSFVLKYIVVCTEIGLETL